VPTLCIFPSPLTSLSSSKAPTALGARTLLGAIPQLLHSSYIARIQNPTLAGSPSWPVPEDSEMFYDLTNFLKSSNQVVMRGLYFRDFTQFCFKGMVSSGFLFLLFVSFFLSFDHIWWYINCLILVWKEWMVSCSSFFFPAWVVHQMCWLFQILRARYRPSLLPTLPPSVELKCCQRIRIWKDR